MTRQSPRFRTLLASGCLTAGAIVMTACGAPSTPEVSAGSLVEMQCPPVSAGDYYFSIGSLAPTRTGDASLRQQYAELLRETEASPLWCGEGPLEAYRLLWLPAYGPALVVSAARSLEGWAIQGVEYAKRDPREIAGWLPARRTERPVSGDDMSPVSATLERGSVWSTSFYHPGGEDGARWTFEVRIDDRYRAVTRWSGQDRDLTEAARSMIELAGLEVPQELRHGR